MGLIVCLQCGNARSHRLLRWPSARLLQSSEKSDGEVLGPRVESNRETDQRNSWRIPATGDSTTGPAFKWNVTIISPQISRFLGNNKKIRKKGNRKCFHKDGAACCAKLGRIIVLGTDNRYDLVNGLLMKGTSRVYPRKTCFVTRVKGPTWRAVGLSFVLLD